MKHLLNKFFNGHRLSRNVDLPPYTIRCKFSQGYIPSMGDTQTLVDAAQNIWDIYKESNDWSYLFGRAYQLLEVLAANTSNVTDMSCMFFTCSNLASVHLFDTSNVTDMYHMFYDCVNLTSVPLFDTSSVTDMHYMFYDCTNVQSGALALYQQASSQTVPPTTYHNCFEYCGINTETGRAELEQIPDDWK